MLSKSAVSVFLFEIIWVKHNKVKSTKQLGFLYQWYNSYPYSIQTAVLCNRKYVIILKSILLITLWIQNAALYVHYTRVKI